MPSGTADHPVTNKTEFARWLDEHPDDVPALRKRATEYRSDPRGQNHFGQWLHAKHYAEFARAYENWWLHKPGKFGRIYEDAAPDFARQPGIPVLTSRP